MFMGHVLFHKREIPIQDYCPFLLLLYLFFIDSWIIFNNLDANAFLVMCVENIISSIRLEFHFLYAVF